MVVPGATAAPVVDKFHILRSIDRPRLVLLELREHKCFENSLGCMAFTMNYTSSQSWNFWLVLESSWNFGHFLNFFKIFFVSDLEENVWETDGGYGNYMAT